MNSWNIRKDTFTDLFAYGNILLLKLINIAVLFMYEISCIAIDITIQKNSLSNAQVFYV